MSDWNCYLINLDRSPERLAAMRAQLEGMGLEFARVPGVDGMALPEAEYLQQIRVNRFYKKLSPGEVGCHLSHLRAKTLFASSAAQYALILEDDAYLPDDLPQIVEAAISQREAQGNPLAAWDVLKLMRSRKRKVVLDTLPTGQALVEYGLSVPASTAAAVWTRAAAQNWVQQYQGAVRPIDCDLQHPWEYGLNILALDPPPVTAGTESTMGSFIRRSRNPWPKIAYEGRRFWPKLRHFARRYGWAFLLRWLVQPRQVGRLLRD